MEFSDRRAALVFLQRFKSDGQFMRNLRELLAQGGRAYALSRVSDQQVLEEAASLLASRQLGLRRTYRKVGATSPADESAAQPAPPEPAPPPPQPAAAPPEPQPDEPVFIPNVDAAAMAAAQTEAAQTGVPFCAE